MQLLPAPHWSPAAAVVLLILNVISFTLHPVPAGPLREEALASVTESGTVIQSEEISTPALESWISDRQEQVGEVMTELAAREKSLELGSSFSSFSRYPVDPDESQQNTQGLPATLVIYEKYRPPVDWLDTVEARPLSEIYADSAEPWLDEKGRTMKIDRGFEIMKIPRRMAPMYEYTEHAFGVSRYVLMAVATIESHQGISMVSSTNCQGWGNFCPGTVRLFERKDLLPEGFSPYDDFDGIAGIAVHLRVSSLGLTGYRQLSAELANDPEATWPSFWEGETPEYSLFEKHSWKYPIIPATWGYNRSSYYGWSVAQLAHFYQIHDVMVEGQNAM